MDNNGEPLEEFARKIIDETDAPLLRVNESYFQRGTVRLAGLIPHEQKTTVQSIANRVQAIHVDEKRFQLEVKFTTHITAPPGETIIYCSGNQISGNRVELSEGLESLRERTAESPQLKQQPEPPQLPEPEKEIGEPIDGEEVKHNFLRHLQNAISLHKEALEFASCEFTSSKEIAALRVSQRVLIDASKMVDRRGIEEEPLPESLSVIQDIHDDIFDIEQDRETGELAICFGGARDITNVEDIINPLNSDADRREEFVRLLQDIIREIKQASSATLHGYIYPDEACSIGICRIVLSDVQESVVQHRATQTVSPRSLDLIDEIDDAII